MLELAPAVRPTPLPSCPQPPERSPVRSFLPEVQALRALAVGLVVLYHFWPNRLPGGFVGVDVFFVISGFLITSHLHREVRTRGRIGLASFYARRARRLLPASLVVLLVAAAGTVVFLPAARWSTTADQLLASSLYVQNWLLAEQAVDYSASQNAASAVQHFWSLSVEEQFYLVWPPLILLLLLLAGRVRRIGRDALLLGGILTVSGVSLAWSVYATATDPAAAYFTTPTRIWELGAGAALALGSSIRADRGPVRGVSSRALPIALRWSGVAAIVAAAVTFTSATPFPGHHALLPVLATVAVIAAGETGRRDPSTAVVHLAPVQFLGNVSYSLYLWHWPAIVILPFALDRVPVARDKLVVLVLCVALAWLTRALVETPALRWRALSRPRPTALAAGVAMLLVAAGSAVIWHQAGQEENAALSRLAAAQADPCFGAGAMGPDRGVCADPFRFPDALTLTAMDTPWFSEPACAISQKTIEETFIERRTCDFSSGSPTRTVALVGDSHADHWRGALHAVARELDWDVVEFSKAACPVTDAGVYSFLGGSHDPATTEACRQWGRKVDGELAQIAPDYVFTSGFVGVMQFDEDPDRSLDNGAQGFIDTWQRWVDRGAHVFVLRDVPSTAGRNMFDCVALNPEDPLACARPRSEAVQPDALTEGARRMDSDAVHLVDLSDRFCDPDRCYAAVGGAVVYFDLDHMTSQFNRSMAPALLESIAPQLG